MAKSLRSSVKKSNRTKLRAKVFGPVENARTERLSAKLVELASQPRQAKSENEIDGLESKEELRTETGQDGNVEAMEVDTQAARSARSSSNSKRTGRHKVSKRKARNMITFPSQKQKRTVSKRRNK